MVLSSSVFAWPVICHDNNNYLEMIYLITLPWHCYPRLLLFLQEIQ